jgi:hypothetical protein
VTETQTAWVASLFVVVAFAMFMMLYMMWVLRRMILHLYRMNYEGEREWMLIWQRVNKLEDRTDDTNPVKS